MSRMTLREWYSAFETDPESLSIPRQRQKRADEYHRKYLENVASYGITEGDLVVLTDHANYGLVRGDRLHVDVLGLICRLVPKGAYVDIDKLKKVDPSMGVFIRRWDSRGSLVGGKVRRLTDEEWKDLDQFASSLYEERRENKLST